MASLIDSVKNIFSNSHKGTSLGVDIGASSIKVVVVEKVDERAILRNYAEIALGPRADMAVGQATSLSPEKIAEALRDVLREAGIVAKHTLVAIPFSASLLSVVELPDVGDKELASMVPLEARRYIPVPLAEVSLDWWALPKRKNEKKNEKGTEGVSVPIGKVEVIIAAIHNEVIKKFELIEREANLPGATSHFEIEIFSTLRAVVGRDLSPVMVVDIGAGSTKLALVDEGVVRGSHVISLGGQDITLALSRSQGISFAKAEEVKCRAGVVGEDEGRDVAAVGELILANIMNEAARFSENYEIKHATKIEKVILVGGSALLKGLEKIAQKNFPTASVAIGDPFGRVDTPAFLASTIKELSPRFAVALGVALKGLEE
jgi:type IV pilus assembly protein PilM